MSHESLSLGARPLLRRAKRGSALGFAGQRGLFFFLQRLTRPDLKSLDSSKQILEANLYNVTCFQRSRECC